MSAAARMTAEGKRPTLSGDDKDEPKEGEKESVRPKPHTRGVFLPESTPGEGGGPGELLGDTPAKPR